MVRSPGQVILKCLNAYLRCVRCCLPLCIANPATTLRLKCIYILSTDHWFLQLPDVRTAAHISADCDKRLRSVSPGHSPLPPHPHKLLSLRVCKALRTLRLIQCTSRTALVTGASSQLLRLLLSGRRTCSHSIYSGSRISAYKGTE